MYSKNWNGWKKDHQELLLDRGLQHDPKGTPVISQETWAKVAFRNKVRSRGFAQIAHPIRLAPECFRHFAGRFEKLMYKEVPDGRLGETSMALVGRKKAPTEKPWGQPGNVLAVVDVLGVREPVE
jgi:hypothetical protein